jgi:hypothetical protein
MEPAKVLALHKKFKVGSKNKSLWNFPDSHIKLNILWWSNSQLKLNRLNPISSSTARGKGEMGRTDNKKKVQKGYQGTSLDQ